MWKHSQHEQELGLHSLFDAVATALAKACAVACATATPTAVALADPLEPWPACTAMLMLLKPHTCWNLCTEGHYGHRSKIQEPTSLR